MTDVILSLSPHTARSLFPSSSFKVSRKNVFHPDERKVVEVDEYPSAMRQIPVEQRTERAAKDQEASDRHLGREESSLDFGWDAG